MTIPTITGTISHGTLRTEDLIPAFARTLLILDGERPIIARAERAHLLSADEQDWLLADLQDAIHDALPEGWCFGTHEGDGSCYGVWECEPDE